MASKDTQTWQEVVEELMKLAETPTQIELLTKFSKAEAIGDVTTYERQLMETRREHNDTLRTKNAYAEGLKDALKIITRSDRRYDEF